MSDQIYPFDNHKEISGIAFDCCDIYDVVGKYYEELFGELNLLTDLDAYNSEEHLEHIYYTLRDKNLLDEFVEKFVERKEEIDGQGFLNPTKFDTEHWD